MQENGDPSAVEDVVPDLVADRALVTRLGAIIKERRAGRYTIETLAERAGVSAGLISQIERGIGNPSFSTLVRLSYALDFPLSTMFEGPSLDEREVLVRRSERQRLEVPADGTVHEILVPAGDHKLGLMSTVFPPGFSNEESPNSHRGEEIVLVMSGVLHASIGGRDFVLEAGDTLIFDSTHAHTWRNLTDSPTEVLHVSTPPASGVGH